MAEICSLHESVVTYEYEEVCEEESIFDNIGQTSLCHVWTFFTWLFLSGNRMEC